MKKKFLVLLTLLVLLCTGSAQAQNAEDNQSLGSVDFADYATITFTSFAFCDDIPYVDKAWSEVVSFPFNSPKRDRWDRDSRYYSGGDAEYALLQVDIVNLTINPQNYKEAMSSIIFVYKDTYEFEGTLYQYNANTYPDRIQTVATKNVDPMYEGHFAIVCMLPNAVVKDTASPLKVEIEMADHQIIHHIRK